MTYTLSKQYVWKEIGDQVVILHFESGRYFSLNASGSIIWKAVLENLPHDKIIARLRAEFDVDTETAEKDTLQMIHSFVDRKFLVQN